MMLTIMISFAVLAVLVVNEYDPGSGWRTDVAYSQPDRTLKQLQNDVAELIQLKNKSLAEQRDSLLNISLPSVHARVNTLAEIVRSTSAPAFIEKLVDVLAEEATFWWIAQEKQQLIDENAARIQKLPALTYAQLEEVKQKGINIIKP